jgi:hypothetical protein
MWHVNYTQLNQGDSWLLVDGSQTTITFVLSTQMGHTSLF